MLRVWSNRCGLWSKSFSRLAVSLVGLALFPHLCFSLGSLVCLVGSAFSSLLCSGSDQFSVIGLVLVSVTQRFVVCISGCTAICCSACFLVCLCFGPLLDTIFRFVCFLGL